MNPTSNIKLIIELINNKSFDEKMEGLIEILQKFSRLNKIIR